VAKTASLNNLFILAARPGVAFPGFSANEKKEMGSVLRTIAVKHQAGWQKILGLRGRQRPRKGN
jgi:hypothetical protein